MMNVFRMVQRTSPWGLVIAGVTLAVALPPVRKGLRCAAVVATRGVLGIADRAMEFAANIREEAEDIVAEARASETCDFEEGWEEMIDAAKEHHRNIAVGAATAGIAVQEHIGEHAQAVRESVSNIMEEAKNRRGRRGNATITSPVNNIESTNEDEQGL